MSRCEGVVIFAMVSTARSVRYTALATASFFRHTSLSEGDEFLLIGNDPGALPELDGIGAPCHLTMLENDTPRSFAANANLAMRRASDRGCDLVFLNNDIVFTPNWLGPLLTDDKAIVLPMCNQQMSADVGGLRLTYFMTIEEFGGRHAELDAIASAHATAQAAGPPRRDVLMPFYCIFLPNRVFSAVGAFDEDFGSGGGEDIDYRVRALLAGFDVRYAPQSFLLHFMGRATWRSGETDAETRSRDARYRLRFEQKWGTRLASLMLPHDHGTEIAAELGVSEAIARGDFLCAIRRCLPASAPEPSVVGAEPPYETGDAPIDESPSLENGPATGGARPASTGPDAASAAARSSTMSLPDPNGHVRRYARPYEIGDGHRGLDYITFLKTIGDALHPRSYVEIGTNSGLSLQQFRCDAMCIDPHFKIGSNVLHERRRSFFFQQRSDDFFRDEDVSRYLPGGYDLAFLDGLHHFEATLRDFMNIERASHSRSVILIHDCLPTSLDMTSRRFNGGDWTGDVWRLLPILRKYRPDLRVACFDCPPTGLVACTRLDAGSTIFRENYFQIVDEFADVPLDENGLHGIGAIYPYLDSAKMAASTEELTLVFG